MVDFWLNWHYYYSMFRRTATFIFLVLVGLSTSNCAMQKAEWMQGPKADGITSYDTCFKCGEQIVWILPEENHMQKSLEKKGQLWTSDKYLEW